MKIFKIKRNHNRLNINLVGIKFSIKQDSDKLAQKNYAKKLLQIKKKYGKEKIIVGFLVNEQAKWQYQSLYEALDKSPLFTPIILISKMVISREETGLYKSIEECYEFFKSQKYNVKYVYDTKTKKYTQAKDLEVDILFYQQPWYLDESQYPLTVSKHALTCYVPYGLHLVEYDGSYTQIFHKLLWQMFVEDQSQIDRFARLMNRPIHNCSVVGYPKLDAYFNVSEGIYEPPVVIYVKVYSFLSYLTSTTVLPPSSMVF